MKFSKKTEYAIRALIYLGLKNQEERTSLKEISENENISFKYLEQIFSSLKRNGIVEGVKGQNGGYLLLRKKTEISLLDIYEIFELESLLKEKNEIKDSKIGNILEQNILQKMRSNIAEFLKDITLDYIIQEYIGNNMYYI